ncbi:hypothetical protein ACJMK2_012613 [Sinanodonta woodiana]|uniref:Phosphatidylinositol transfer protein N-terminal domain-containing protein n=1 Tax=Sinanodonta woodiana TaxID=1069815 RepID=A0ABD3VBT0_SINWO
MPPTSPSISEFRVVLPMDVDEYKVAQLYSVAEASKNETGGGEGIEVLVNEPFGDGKHPPEEPLEANGQVFSHGQFTHKIYHLASKVPKFIRLLAPKGSLEIHEKAWNAYPYCRTVITNPDYMKENFYIRIETMHMPDNGQIPNVHLLGDDDLKIRKVVHIDIANDHVSPKDYKEEWDPRRYKSTKTGRGPLDSNDWQDKVKPVMCAYKLVSCKFKWFGLQNRVEKFIQTQEQRLFTLFHRQVFCWTDKWYGMTMDDIREWEEKTKRELDEQRSKGDARGLKAED